MGSRSTRRPVNLITTYVSPHRHRTTKVLWVLWVKEQFNINRRVLDAEPRRFMLGLFVFAAALRICATLFMRDFSAGPPASHSADDFQFNLFAINLALGKGYVGAHGDPT